MSLLDVNDNGSPQLPNHGNSNQRLTFFPITRSSYSAVHSYRLVGYLPFLAAIPAFSDFFEYYIHRFYFLLYRFNTFQLSLSIFSYPSSFSSYFLSYVLIVHVIYPWYSQRLFHFIYVHLEIPLVITCNFVYCSERMSHLLCKYPLYYCLV